MEQNLLLATRNKDKQLELSALLKGIATIHHPDEFSEEEVEETGNTLWENALLKAEDGFKRSGLPTVADDTGLEVDALNGAPGVYSSRYAGINVTYEDNVKKLLEDLKNVELDKRTARFRTVVAYKDNKQVKKFEGTIEGLIITERMGADGFGYDPVFKPLEIDKTLAEISVEEKNKISHRGRAFMNFIDWFRDNINSIPDEQ